MKLQVLGAESVFDKGGLFINTKITHQNMN